MLRQIAIFVYAFLIAVNLEARDLSRPESEGGDHLFEINVGFSIRSEEAKKAPPIIRKSLSTVPMFFVMSNFSSLFKYLLI